ncbi:HEPN domain-containing protein [Anaerosporobacter mobilis]|nr:HEPN domain-containing protein [Anaerosporobacter mobilis]
MQNNTIYGCRVVKIDGIDVNFLSELSIDETYTTKIIIKDVERNCYSLIKDKEKVVIIMKIDGEYLTVITSYLLEKSFRHCNNRDLETGITLSYRSSTLLVGYVPKAGVEIAFDGFSCEITECIEMLGLYPFVIENKDNYLSKIDMNISGDVKYKFAGRGFSCFVAPIIKKKREGMNISMYGKIQFDDGSEKSLDEIKQLLRKVILFFEILSGETITVLEAYLNLKNSSFEYIGASNFSKSELSHMNNWIDTRSYLRKSLFKASDFGQSIEQAIDKFLILEQENNLAFKAYKQILLDEEINLNTYNKFLKIMQVVEGYQRAKVDEEEQRRFDEQKDRIISILETNDQNFVKKYTTYNGQNFRKCLNTFTYDSMKLISDISKTKARDTSKEVIDRIINDRDVYTHASKELEPQLTSDEMSVINYCYKTFFRILILSNMGMETSIIRKRLFFERRFRDYYEKIFGIEIESYDLEDNMGEFDSAMWGYDV